MLTNKNIAYKNNLIIRIKVPGPNQQSAFAELSP